MADEAGDFTQVPGPAGDFELNVSPIEGLLAYPRRLGFALFDPPGRFPLHQVGQPRLPRYLCPLEQAFQPPRFGLGIAYLGPENNCSTCRSPFFERGLALTTG